MRELVQYEGAEGGFAAVYAVLRQMEEAGRVRRGYFVAGRGAAQFALSASGALAQPKLDATLKAKAAGTYLPRTNAREPRPVIASSSGFIF